MIASRCIRTMLVAGTAGLTTLPAAAEILYRHGQATLFDGRYGPIAQAQTRANAALTTCGKPASITVDGKFGKGMQDALVVLAKCPAVAPKLAADAEARAGALTTAYWEAIVGDPSPTVDDRARTIMLTFEATDYTRLEWNFCQSKPLYDPQAGHPVCYSNDPHSYLTWGPNGATGGGGREVQLILDAVDKTTPALIDRSFGTEAESVRRMFRLPDRDAGRSLETYLCGIWIDPQRRNSWKNGFGTIGQELTVRTKYDDLYKSSSLDGGKIATFIRAYKENSLTPTEIDYAFFKDRAAHTSPPYEPIRQAIADRLQASPGALHWQVRQAIALAVGPKGTQREDRLGRDVAFYVDGAGQTLGAEERAAWQARGPVKASDAGLSDARDYTNFRAGRAIDTHIANPATLTPAERMKCPPAVLATRKP